MGQRNGDAIFLFLGLPQRAKGAKPQTNQQQFAHLGIVPSCQSGNVPAAPEVPAPYAMPPSSVTVFVRAAGPATTCALESSIFDGRCLSLTPPSCPCALLRRRRAAGVRCQDVSKEQDTAERPLPGTARVGECGGSRPPHSSMTGRCGMTRTVIAISIMTLGAVFTVFMITMAASYEVNEQCTEQMAWDGNC